MAGGPSTDQPPPGSSSVTKALYFAGAAIAIVGGSIITALMGVSQPVPIDLLIGVPVGSAICIGLGGLYHNYYDH